MEGVLSFADKKRKKDRQYEQSMLRELSLEKIISSVDLCFRSIFHLVEDSTYIKDGCVDFAIEAFLLGASFGKFGYYGESAQMAVVRSEKEERELQHDFYEYIYHWSDAFRVYLNEESLYIECEQFIRSWWIEGFSAGKKRLKLRLR
ncbi:MULTISPECIES: DUF2521 family protein [Bacillus]|uniref:DUF2521 domain-containing protein n=2 Tax=Bacillus TaxID=1386 RepID=A0A0M4GC03_9BACI|nr:MULTISPECIES: DUF2521 family protein [Bacillus]ALC83378.1 hypothetical protein AM592_18825 [Bacillus gobiensis]MBP1084133.1 hypothetical protein [Bacillus capparidis]MED1095551.1 DUF2521 family protein [Bacillus capparidis]